MCAVDRDSGRSKGFAFITMEDARDATDACKKLNGEEVDGRDIKVEIAKPRGERSFGGGGGGGGYGGGRGGGKKTSITPKYVYSPYRIIVLSSF